MKVNGKHYRTVWMNDQSVMMIDQLRLPHFFEIAELKTHKDTANSISTMMVRGAGAIGATAGFGMAQVALEAPEGDSFYDYVEKGFKTIEATRPTAQNLFYAIRKVQAAIDKAGSIPEARAAAVATAQAIADEDASFCEAIGVNAQQIMENGIRILTHCNAGWLAFVDWGSALSPVYKAIRQGKEVTVFADETRPRSQGATLTAWELINEGVPYYVIPDNASGYLMRKGEIDIVIVGSDRIAANGDVANKIGTYEDAVVAHELGIPFYVAAPSSTIDPDCPKGDLIPIEERSHEEVQYAYGLLENGEFGQVLVTPENASVKNPAFDITPREYVTGIITEKGLFSPENILDSVE